ncbi:GNAT family N-acetyltransferase [Flavobacterium sp. 3HN19-14]|uniref:GNAT family N-acetyltransferase n=1 Tax=Flavobacterium sp. 3HN19-14 TaxID=3448133 RepID=UPI003EE0A8D2
MNKLTTERLTLRKLSKNDAEAILQLRSSPEVNKFLNRKPSKTLEDATDFIRNITENESDDLFYWAITKTENETLIGTICLFEFLSDMEKCEIGYELLPEYQGNGFMIEAVRKVIEYAHEKLGLKIIDAISHKENLASTGLLQKFGFTELPEVVEENPDLVLFRLTTID